MTGPSLPFSADDVSTSLLQSEERFRLLFESAPASMWVFDVETLRILAVNDFALAQYAYTRDEFLRLTLRDLRPASELAAFWRAFASMQSGHDIRGFFRHRRKNGEIFDVEVATQPLPLGDGRLRLGTARDISDQRRALDAARFLDSANSLLTSSLDELVICRNLSAVALPRLGDWCAVYRHSDHGLRCCGFTHLNPMDEEFVAERVRTRRLSPEHPLFRAMTSARSIIFPPSEHHTVTFETSEHGPIHDPRLNVRSAMYVAMRARGRTLGVIEFVFTADRGRPSQTDAALAEELASRAAMAIDNALLYEEARQRAHPPTLTEAGRATPARGVPVQSGLPVADVETILESILDGCLALDAEWRITYANRRAEDALRCPREELVGHVLWSLFPGLSETEFGAAYRRARSEHRPIMLDAYYATLDSWFEVAAHPVGHGLVLFFRNSSDQHQAREERESLDHALRESLEHASDLIHMLSADGRVLFANAAWRNTLGYRPQDADRLNLYDVVAPEWREAARAVRERCMAGERVREIELEVVTRDGRRVRVRGGCEAHFVRGRAVATFGVFHDVSRENAAAEALRLSERAVASAKRAKDEFLTRMRHELRTPLTSIIGFARLLEENPHQTLGARDLDFANRIARRGRELLDLFEDVLVYADIEARRLERDTTPTLVADVVRNAAAAAETQAREHDVTIETAIPAKTTPIATDESKLRQLVGLVLRNAIRTANGGTIRVSVAVDADTNAPLHVEVATGTPTGHATLGGGGMDLLGTIARSLAHSIGCAITFPSSPDGAGAVRIDLGGVSRAELTDTSDSRSSVMHAAAAGSAEAVASLLHTVVNASPLAIVVYDADLTIRLWNDTATRMLGWTADEMIGRVIPRELEVESEGRSIRDLVRDALASDGLTEVPVRRRRKDGQLFDAHSSIAPLRDADGRLIGFVSMISDVTEHNRLEAELRQAQKMEVVGRLAGGIAHDFNNLLTVIRAYGSFLLESLESSDDRRPDAEEIVAAADRAAALTKQLLVFARKETPRQQSVDVRRVLSGFETMLRRLIPSNIEVAVLTPAEACYVVADPAQLEQVVLNLALNARDAMPDGGTLLVEVSCADVVPAAEADGAEQATPATGYVRLTVSDTGFGMSAETRAHIFEPFFTTKAVGRGTGLGLATVYAIVTAAGGQVEVESEPGAGTKFHIYLPRVAAATEQSNPDDDDVSAWRGTETILLVDDQEGVRSVAARMLRSRGYSVLAARHGSDALQLASAHEGRIDLLVTDMVMPEMDGLTVANRLRRQHPEMRVVFISGYSDEVSSVRAPDDDRSSAAENMPVLRKPFTADDLARAVRRALACDQRS